MIRSHRVLDVGHHSSQIAHQRIAVVKVEFPDKTTGIGEWMWMIVDHTDNKKRQVEGLTMNH